MVGMTGVSALDDKTTNAIREAVAAAAAGKLEEACQIGERTLAGGGDRAALNAMLGMFRSQVGDHERAIDHLRIAHNERPADLKVTRNLASALARQGRNQDALDVITEALARADSTLQLWKLRGFLAQALEQFEPAVRAYEQVVAADASDWESWNNLGNARRGAGDLDGSIGALRRAVEINSAVPPVRLNLANALIGAGLFEEAEQMLRAMAEEFPDDAKPLRQLHALQKQEGRDEEALASIEEAVNRDPDDLDLLLALASHRLAMLQHVEAEAAYAEVVRRDPGNQLGNLGLAIVFELTNRTGQLAELVDDAAARGVHEDALNFIRAFDHRRSKQFEEGLTALSKVPAELESARRAHLLGQLEEGAGNYDAAFAAFDRMNEIQRDDASEPEIRAAAYRSNVRRQMDLLVPKWVAGWRASVGDDRPSPAFLLGFPRSGTTLLDTMLMGHPAVEVLEEEPGLRHASQVLPEFEMIPSASDEQICDARDAYFEVAESKVRLQSASVLIDKNPLASNGLPVIRRLFPDAKIILALRHPCDVVFSCFATNFKLNDGMANFLRLETAAELYDLTFSYFERARDVFRFPVHEIRYESVVADRDTQLRALSDFLDLDWHDAMLDHQSTAQGRAHIKTASYAQVMEPIYDRSAGRWLNYRKHLEPVLPILEPWVKKLGYEL
jgi:tetratricopeptide (TPR) repeat protein